MKSAPVTGTRVLLTLASFVIVVAGLRAAEAIIVPFLLSALIAMICSPPLFWMQRRGVPTSLSVLIIVIGIMVLGLIFGTVIGTSLNSFAAAAPTYQQRLQEETADLFIWLQGMGVEVSREVLSDYFDPAKAMEMIAASLKQVGGVLTNAFLILITVVFILLEAAGLPTKLHQALSNPDESMGHFRKITENVKQYLALKTLLSLGTGFCVTFLLLFLGVDYAILWGIIAFLLNYIPNIGSIIASVPAVLLAFVQFGPGKAAIVAVGYLAINMLFGPVIEPRIMGRGLGLSTLVVFLSLVFWGWVLGPVGMLLSVVLTMIVKIALESRNDTRWIGILLGGADAPPVPEAEEA
jgi:predicted PurR-regulated permease PerM